MQRNKEFSRKQPQVSRKDKNEPIEVSSKKSVSRKRQVTDVIEKKSFFKDPRFEPLAGNLNVGIFSQNYSFLKDYRNDEIEILKNEIKKTSKNNNTSHNSHISGSSKARGGALASKGKESNEAENDKLLDLKKSLDSLQSRKKAAIAHEKQKSIKKQLVGQERSLIQKGKKPYFLKKSEVKKMQLLDLFKNLEEGQREKFIEKKRKRNAAKEHLKIPKSRRSQ